MKPEDIKVGETYYVRVKVLNKSDKHIGCCTIDENGKHLVEFLTDEAPAFVKMSPYDKRLHKKGDLVELTSKIKCKSGRIIERGELATIISDVSHDISRFWGEVTVKLQNDGTTVKLTYDYIELVTPVEELEPYRVDHNQYGWHVEKDGEILATYNDSRHPHAKEAAEAERDRLNEEYRKEQK